LNTVVIVDENRLIGTEDLVDGAIRLSAGRKHHVLVKPEA
jgi:tyrosyl-tRNA synthetase